MRLNNVKAVPDRMSPDMFWATQADTADSRETANRLQRRLVSPEKSGFFL
jgi:hypothetical protein